MPAREVGYWDRISSWFTLNSRTIGMNMTLKRVHFSEERIFSEGNSPPESWRRIWNPPRLWSLHLQIIRVLKETNWVGNLFRNCITYLTLSDGLFHAQDGRAISTTTRWLIDPKEHTSGSGAVITLALAKVKSLKICITSSLWKRVTSRMVVGGTHSRFICAIEP